MTINHSLYLNTQPATATALNSQRKNKTEVF
jgi:hypothetical protein